MKNLFASSKNLVNNQIKRAKSEGSLYWYRWIFGAAIAFILIQGCMAIYRVIVNLTILNVITKVWGL